MKIGLIYYGGQYNHLILKNLKYLGANVDVIIPNKEVDEIKDYDGLIFSGGPYSVASEIDKMGNSPLYIKKLKIPMLGICLGHQLIAYVLGGIVKKADNPEFGLTKIQIHDEDTILKGLPKELNVWESHNDEVVEPPKGFKVLASSSNAKVQAMVNAENTIFSVQFHPEVKHTEKGTEIFKNFLNVCKR
ncbi:GMP synthase [Sulfolobus sp. A20]|uniref:GMP synthase subunit A n=1 Tax=Sulfolobaceae TaxID=118883 RepID=UPI0008460DF1|nr:MULTISPECIES: GMP synthase subunit A [unclassified Sulfolobus]TRM78221.1 GMP synthase [Sulfolobus sp. B5]TRM78381.1 GMP synthase [Sulfolobus sp. A20-N-F8]TRM83637.1 GMP synthase [Sulfolobus sp. A20-N-F6]TRM85376.1 GMP synthase [Sulfolobus sp. F3]TRM89089.1 GMP synthase [Sulfolobus sp. C3]TRM94525.1 GMP synthase [Sulfolobus sp. A20-N-G8]TRN02645.1 GMP synthase [Sulfolobus sp. E1]TRN04179.1 GMP synthase [Sulfolobus sp. F1]